MEDMTIKSHIRAELITSAPKWNREIMMHPCATYFHSWEWGMLTSSTFGWMFRPYKIISSTATFYCGIFVTPTGLFASPIGYGGILAIPESRTSADEWLAVVRQLEEAECQPFQRIVFPPLFQGPPERLLERRFLKETSIVTLPNDRSTLWTKIFSGNARTSVRAATRRGVKVSLSDDLSSVDAFYPIYEETAERVQFGYRTPRSLIKSLVSQGSDRVWFITATYDDEPVAFGLFFHFGSMVFHWINAYQYELRQVYANAAILDLGFSLAIERKATSFNLGGSYTSRQVFSKSNWGARLEPYYIYERSITR